MDKVLEDIWRMAQANSLQTKTVKTPAIQHDGGYAEQTMELSLTGDFGGFYQFTPPTGRRQACIANQKDAFDTGQ